VVADRRVLHQIPEIGLELEHTAAAVQQRLEELEIPTQRVLETGVVGLLRGKAQGPTLLLRADMDGLPISEEAEHEYVSTHPGAMHACGHDAHMAMLLGAARLLKAEGLPRGQVKLCFQPGEEGHHGAAKMIAAGVLDNPRVDTAFGLHIWAMAPVGTILVGDGPVMAAVDTVRVQLTGKGAHAALPHEGVDPLYCGAQIVTALQSIVSRNIDPLEPAVVTVSEFHAGVAHNIIAEQAQLTLSVRVFDPEAHDLLEQRIKQVITGTAAALGCDAQVTYVREHGATVNDPSIARLVREEAQVIVGSDQVSARQKTMGAEDMSDFLSRVPGAFAFVGAHNVAKDCCYPHHHPRFNVDEDGLAIGVELLCCVTRRLLEEL